MSARSAVLGRRTSASNSELFTLATVPADETWIVKTLAAYNASGFSAAVEVIVESADAAVAVSIALATNIADGTATSWTGWVVMSPGDVLKVFQSHAGMKAWVSGARLLGHV